MTLGPSRHREATIALAAVALRSIAPSPSGEATGGSSSHPGAGWSGNFRSKETRKAMRHGGERWPYAMFVTIAVTVLALMLSIGPVVAANASTTGSTQPGVSPRGHFKGDGFADLAVVVAKEDLVAMHNELIGTDPSDGAQLDAGPARVTLTFDLPAQRGFSTVIVTGPDGNQWQAGPATEDGTKVSTPVRPLGPAGEYTVAWRILSADGHPTRGTLRFTLTIPGTGTVTAPPLNTDRSGSATPANDTESTSAPVWPWLAGAGALLVVGVVMALRARRTHG